MISDYCGRAAVAARWHSVCRSSERDVVAHGAIKTMARVLDEYFEGRVPCRLTDDGTAVGLYEIQQRQMSDLAARASGQDFKAPVL